MKVKFRYVVLIVVTCVYYFLLTNFFELHGYGTSVGIR